MPALRRFPLFWILLLTFLVYLPTLSHQFVWDDIHFILEWPAITSFNHLPELLSGQVPNGQGITFRPIRSLFYLFTYQLWGTNPFYYHLQAILIHLLAVTLVYLVTSRLTAFKLVRVLTPTLFALHPLNTEAVAFITASYDIIGLIFYLLSFYFYLAFRQGQSNAYRLSLLFAALAFFSYELTFTLPLLLMLYDRLVVGTKPFRLKPYLPYLLILLLYFLLRLSLTPTLIPSFVQGSRLATLTVMLVALFQYLRLLFVPFPLTVNFPLIAGITAFYSTDFNPVTMTDTFSLTHPLILLSVIALIIWFFLGIKLTRRHSLAALALLYLPLTFLPVLQLVPTNTLFAQDYAYPATIFISLFISLAFHGLLVKNHLKPVLVFIVLSLILGGFTLLTFNRLQDWSGSVSLWQSTLKFTPNSSRAHTNLALAYYQQNQFELAETHFSQALELTPQDLFLRYRYANFLLSQGRLDLALTEFDQLASDSSDPFTANSQIGQLLISAGYPGQARKYLQAALEISPSPELIRLLDSLP